MRKVIALGLVVAFSLAIVMPLMAQDKIDLNSASASQLQALNRVGPKTAAKIVAEREANGPFSSLADVARRTKGIGSKTIAKWVNAECIPPAAE